MKELIILGYGGHGKVIREIAEELSIYHVIGYIDLFNQGFEDLEYLGTDDQIADIHKKHPTASFVLGIGNLSARRNMIEILKSYDLEFACLISKSAIVSPSAKICEGSVILRGAIVNTSAIIGRHGIINSGSIVEHDCKLGENVHIAPGACLGGSVEIGSDSLIASHATVILGKRVGNNCTVGAGAVVLSDVEPSAIVVGCPAKSLKRGKSS